MKKIVFSGPESTGKTTLATKLALHLDEPLVAEYATYYLTVKATKYTLEDISIILAGQLKWEDFFSKQAKEFLICDTDPLVLYVWAKDKFGFVPENIVSNLEKDNYNIRFLCPPDIPWNPGPFREDQGNRERLYKSYLEACHEFGLKKIELWGTQEEKFETILKVI